MRILVCGGRDFKDKDFVFLCLDRLRKERGINFVITGCAKGADSLASEWAKSRGVGCDIYKADWNRLGRKAGP